MCYVVTETSWNVIYVKQNGQHEKSLNKQWIKEIVWFSESIIKLFLVCD